MSTKKQNKIDIRPYTRQFYKGNVHWFILSLCNPIITTIGGLIISWLLQQVLDLIAGVSIAFSLKELLLIATGLMFLFFIYGAIDYHATSRFITRGISQYKNHVFGELTKKNVSAFSRENSATYISLRSPTILQPFKKVFLKIFSLSWNKRCSLSVRLP